ncbi:cytochrome P450 734A1-like isoform X2 [Cornus florida]|uniref:cytochrome P450 734A1-like isoform X2 n=1 Tax=Cornus florida TaxID=4283 RepID=UPI00289C49CA|nr:cytochrome P450 734A1-like isoform X2 [Cornus florida]
MEDKFNYLFWILIISYTVMVIVFKIMVNLWWRPRKIEQHFSKQGIEGPPYRFFAGNMKELLCLMSKAASQPMPALSHNILPRVLSFYHHWNKIYGATFLVWFGTRARLTISDPVLIREIFILKSDLFEKNDSPHLVRKAEGDGLLNLKGPKWAHHRKIIRPTFHLENLKMMIPMMGKSIAKMLDKWAEMSNCGKVEIEISEWFTTLTEEVIMQTVFGSGHEDGRPIFKLQTQQMIFAIQSYNNVHIPGFRFLPTKKNRICWRLDSEIGNYLVKLIHERIKNYSTNQVSEECPTDLLDAMIRAKLKGTSSVGTIPKSKSNSSTRITVHDIVEECKTFFFAGKQTVSNLLTWTTILLAMHPQWQELAREEVFTVCGSRDVPAKDDLPKLKMSVFGLAC